MVNIALLRFMSHQLELMVDELEILDEDLSEFLSSAVSTNTPFLLNDLIIELNECSAKIDKLISYNTK